MIYNDEDELRARIKEVTGRTIPGPIEIIDDTTDFMGIDRDEVLRLAGNDWSTARSESMDLSRRAL